MLFEECNAKTKILGACLIVNLNLPNSANSWSFFKFCLLINERMFTVISKTFGRKSFGKKLRTKTFGEFFGDFGQNNFGQT